LSEDDEAIGMAGISNDGTDVHIESCHDIKFSDVQRIFERDKNSIHIRFNQPVDDAKATPVYDQTVFIDRASSIGTLKDIIASVSI
jgi:hypothetical protein